MRLREALALDEDQFPLLRNRAVRDSFEHMDERIDGYLAGRWPPLDLAAVEAGVFPDHLRGDPMWMRRIDPNSARVEVLGRHGEFDGALQRLGDRS